MPDTPEPPIETFQMTPDQATQKLNEMAAAFHAPPPPVNPAIPADAAARLRTLMADPAWREKYLTTGDAAVRREFNDLVALMATGDEVIASETELVSTLDDTHAVSKANRATLLDAVREQGAGSDRALAYMEALDRGERTDRPTQGDGLACRQALDRLMKDPGFTGRYLNADIAANNLVNVLNRVIAYAATDDAPVSDNTLQALTELGLR